MEIGRLAPTPSGLLHLGNGRSFLLAWLWARSSGGRVVMRVEDIDRPRCRPEFRRQALLDLQWLGLNWDAGPHADDPPDTYDQSTRTETYRAALRQLEAAGLAYPCTCTRRDIAEAASAPHGDDGPVYPGTCRGRWRDAAHAREATGREPAWRFRWETAVEFNDELAGPVRADPAVLGDFVLWRSDDLPAYQLAVVVDDAAQGVTQVLRGRDLLLSTCRQLALYAALGLTPPRRWAHVPLLHDDQGRMAKRSGALALSVLRDTGADPARVVGLLAWTAGLVDAPAPVSPAALVSGFDPARLGREDRVLTREDLAGLGAR